jgi:general secretion pathway protein B
MSYILDALRKSEVERRQGQAPDIGQSVQMVYKPRKKPVPAAFWLTLALLLNAGVLGYVFWPEIRGGLASASMQHSVADSASSNAKEAAQISAVPGASSVSPAVDQEQAVGASSALAQRERQVSEVVREEQPTIIVPRQVTQDEELTPTRPQGRVPHLVELPLSFQKSIPDLTFNSHIVSSNPLASSVMINNQYLRVGDRLGDILVERINEDSVIFSQGGQLFRIGTTRNWMSPR